MSAGNSVKYGGVVSTTSMVCIPVVELPQSSVIVKILSIVYVPVD